MQSTLVLKIFSTIKLFLVSNLSIPSPNSSPFFFLFQFGHGSDFSNKQAFHLIVKFWSVPQCFSSRLSFVFQPSFVDPSYGPVILFAAVLQSLRCQLLEMWYSQLDIIHPLLGAIFFIAGVHWTASSSAASSMWPRDQGGT